MITVEDLNFLSPDEFTVAIGTVVEDSPWIVRAAAEARPFADRDALYAAVIAVIETASEADRLALIAAHPDLAGRVAREGRLSAASRDEQAGAGLDRLTPAEIVRFDAANAAYRSRFGFVFIVCARDRTKASILDAIERRVANSRSDEIGTAIAEIAKIVRLRLEDLIA